jgi:KipI family sensor histidine kinase inhibitor
MSGLRVLPYGESAVLVDVDDPGQVLGLAAAAAGLDGVREVVPAARTVLVVVDDPSSLTMVESALRSLSTAAVATRPDASEVVLDVVYDGADLAETAAEVGLDVDGLVRAHCEADYVVAFCGFAPGFAYLTGLPDALHVSRLAEPRTRVPAGSVAIAGEFTGVYPRSSPGGWRLLGRTDADLWDLGRTPPALLVSGTRVRFRAR